MKINLLIFVLCLEILLSGSSSKSRGENESSLKHSPLPVQLHDKEKDEGAAAVKIQAAARGMLGRQRAKEIREQEKKREEEKIASDRHAAALSVQSVVRGMMGRREAQKKKDEKREEKEKQNAAMKIQAAARGMLGRQCAKEVREQRKKREEEKIDAERNRAAVSVQSAARGMMGRREVQKKKDEKREEEERQNAAKKIQAAARVMLGRKRAKEVREQHKNREEEKIDAERNRAAVSVQSAVRGMMGRREVQKKKDEKREEKERQNAAKKIQAAARGMLGRMEAAKRVEARDTEIKMRSEKKRKVAEKKKREEERIAAEMKMRLEEERKVAEKKKQEEERIAAVSMQAAVRGIMGRREVQTRKDEKLKEDRRREEIERERKRDEIVVYLLPGIRLDFQRRNMTPLNPKYDHEWGLLKINKHEIRNAPLRIIKEKRSDTCLIQFYNIETINNFFGYAINKEEWTSQLQELFGQRNEFQKSSEERKFLLMKAGDVVLTFFNTISKKGTDTDYQIVQVNGVNIVDSSKIKWSLNSSRLLIRAFYIKTVRQMLKSEGFFELAEKVKGREIMDGLKAIAMQEKVYMNLVDTSDKTMEYRNRTTLCNYAKDTFPQKRWWKIACERACEVPEELAWKTYYEIQGFQADEDKKKEYFEEGYGHTLPAIGHRLYF